MDGPDCAGSIKKITDLYRNEMTSRLNSLALSYHLSTCVEHIMLKTDAEPKLDPSVTLEELDEILDRIAATSSFSSVGLRRKIKMKYAQPVLPQNVLSTIFRRLHSLEAKWMIRMLLMIYSPVHVPEILAMKQFHFLLPDLLSIQNSFDAAVKLLSGPAIKSMPVQSLKSEEHQLRVTASRELVPQPRIMITRPTYEKARSIRHYCQLVGPRLLSVERKYNSEYC